MRREAADGCLRPSVREIQRCQLLRLARVVGRQDFEILLDRRHHAGRCTRATLGVEPIRISRQVQKVLACSLPWVIRPGAGIAEGVEPIIGADQRLDLSACAGLDQAHGYFTNDFVTLIAPGPSIVADWEKHQQRKQNVPHGYFPEAQLSRHAPPDTNNKATISQRFIWSPRRQVVTFSHKTTRLGEAMRALALVVALLGAL
jgi:hypothetical protein